MLEDWLNGGNEGQPGEEDLSDIVVRLQHPDHVVSSPKEFAGIWGTAHNNYSELRRRYSHYFTPEGITLSNLLAMSEESFRNPRNRFKGQELRQRQAARIKRIRDYDMSLDGAASQGQSGILTLYQDAVRKQQKGQIDPDVVIYNPFMRPEDVAMAPGQRVYHAYPVWTNGNTEWKNEGKFVDWCRFKEAREKGTGRIVGMLVDFPDAGKKRLVIDANSEYYQRSITPAKHIWGGYVVPSMTPSR